MIRPVNPCGYENCRMIASWDRSAAKQNPISENDPYQNWVYMILHAMKEEIHDPTKAAGMSVFNADNLMFAAQSKQITHHQGKVS